MEVYAISKNYPAGAKYRFEDYLILPFGNDFDYSDITSRETELQDDFAFDGNRVIETAEKLFDGNKDFTLAIDFKRGELTQNNKVLFCCSNANGGFEVICNGENLVFNWGPSGAAASVELEKITDGMVDREILVIRHKNKSPVIDVYYSQKYKDSIGKYSLTTSIQTGEVVIDASLCLGGAKFKGVNERACKCDIYRSKIWDVTLGDLECESLAAWPHETAEMLSMSLYDGDETHGSEERVQYNHATQTGNERSNLTLLSKYLLNKPFYFGEYDWDYAAAAEGWNGNTIDTYLINRYYKGINERWRALIKRTIMPYTFMQDDSQKVQSIEKEVFVPSVKEMSIRHDKNDAPGTFDTMTSNLNRCCSTSENPSTFKIYWTRTTNGKYEVYCINNDGSIGNMWADAQRWVRPMLTI